MASNIKGTTNADTEHLGTLHVYEDLIVDGGFTVDGPTSHGLQWEDQQGNILSAAAAAGLTLGTLRDTGVPVVQFSGTVNETLSLMLQMSHRWKPGTEVRMHAHLMPTATPGVDQNVRFSYTYYWSDPTEAIPAVADWTTGTVDVAIPADGTKTNLHLLVPLFASTPANTRESSILIVKLSRLATDPADTYTSPVSILGLDAHFQCEKPGTVSEY